MKKTKKLAALFLALMMAFSLMAVTAAAYSAEAYDGIMPLGAKRECTQPDCSGTVSLRTVTRYMNWETTCEKCSYRHLHRVPYTVDIEDCDSCSYHNEHPNSDHQFPGVCMHGR